MLCQCVKSHIQFDDIMGNQDVFPWFPAVLSCKFCCVCAVSKGGPRFFLYLNRVYVAFFFCFNLKNSVYAQYELALQPGLTVFEEYPELKDGKVKLDGDNVDEFPKLPEFQQIMLKVLRWGKWDNRLAIKESNNCQKDMTRA